MNQRAASQAAEAAHWVAPKRGTFLLARARDYENVSCAQRVLVALVPSPRDWAIVCEQGWYRIPLLSAPPCDYDHLAFYWGHCSFGARAWQIGCWATIDTAQEVTRRELFPDDPNLARAGREYLKFSLGELQMLARPIRSRRSRHEVFIPTTLDKLHGARELNDLYHESPLEDELWAALKAQNIEAERQWYLSANEQRYCLDFAVFCQNGNIDIECDGDSYHANAEKSRQDNARNNALTRQGWAILRFSTHEIVYEMPQCLSAIRGTILQRGGAEEGKC